MDRESLKRYLEAGMSLPQIGRLVRRDPSTVGYWVEKHGLTANGKEKYAPRGGLTREQLEPFANRDATLQEIADALDRSTSTVRHWLKKHEIQTTSRPGRRPNVDRRMELERALREGLSTITATCEIHGEAEFAVVNASRQRLDCRQCRSEAVVRRRRRVKEILVKEHSGRCRLCGYDRCMAALQFHHLDPKQKSFSVSRRGITRTIAEVRAEARKCVLLCANCHAEVEAGFTRLDPSAFQSATS
jgi:hypothetical protein